MCQLAHIWHMGRESSGIEWNQMEARAIGSKRKK